MGNRPANEGWWTKGWGKGGKGGGAEGEGRGMSDIYFPLFNQEMEEQGENDLDNMREWRERGEGKTERGEGEGLQSEGGGRGGSLGREREVETGE